MFGTKVLTFDTGTYADDTTVEIVYTYTSQAGTQTIVQDATSAPSVVKFIGFAYVKSICDPDTTYYAQIIGEICQIEGNWSWELAADGEGATQPMAMEFIRHCGTGNFYSIIIPDNA